MRTVKKKMIYEEYNELRNNIFEIIPFAIINAEYCNGIGYFNFWDSDYIPDCLKSYIMQIPKSKEDRDKLYNEINKTFAKFNPNINKA